MFPYIMQGNTIVVVIDNKSHSISKSHFSYERIRKAIQENDWDTVRESVDPREVFLEYGSGNVSIKGDRFFWKGEELNGGLARRMVQMFREGFDIGPFVLFMENLMKNTSYRAVEELYTFLEQSNLPITPDGCFLAYKRVNNDFMDCHSNTVLNKPFELLTEDDHASLPYACGVGDSVKVFVHKRELVVTQNRNRVDDNKERTCSQGLHFCSLGYLNHFHGDTIVIVKVNPRDVVSIPVDYNFSKGRTCRYSVVGLLNDNTSAESAFENAVEDW